MVKLINYLTFLAVPVAVPVLLYCIAMMVFVVTLIILTYLFHCCSVIRWYVRMIFWPHYDLFDILCSGIVSGDVDASDSFTDYFLVRWWWHSAVWCILILHWYIHSPRLLMMLHSLWYILHWCSFWYRALMIRWWWCLFWVFVFIHLSKLNGYWLSAISIIIKCNQCVMSIVANENENEMKVMTIIQPTWRYSLWRNDSGCVWLALNSMPVINANVKLNQSQLADSTCVNHWL